MRLLLQRVSEARVEVDGEITGQVEEGLLLLAGFAKGDTQADIDTLVKKTIHMRIFENEQGKFDRSVLDIGGGVLVVSQFTLYADTRKGRRPSFHLAMPPAEAEEMYERLLEAFRAAGVARVEGGRFGANMQVFLCNDGPVTILLESPAEAT